MKIKICGITNLEDAINASRLGADALGFVFYPKSPRYIDPQKAKDIIKKSPPFMQIVGLFVNQKAQEIDQICEFCKIDLAQIHFEMENEEFLKLKTKAIRVIRASSKEDLSLFPNDFKIVDAFVESFGGEGKRLNLEWFKNLDCSKIILAGGLSSENLKELKGFGFYGVDVSSSIEKSHGIKDYEKIKKFIKASNEID